MLAEAIQSFVDRQQFIFLHRRGDFDFIHIESSLAATVPLRLLASSAVNENAAHGLGGGAKEVGAVFPSRLLVAAETEPGFMDQRSGLKGMSGSLLGHFCGGQSPQFIIDKRQQFLGGFRIALLSCFEDSRNVVHAAQTSVEFLGDNSKWTRGRTVGRIKPVA